MPSRPDLSRRGSGPAGRRRVRAGRGRLVAERAGLRGGGGVFFLATIVVYQRETRSENLLGAFAEFLRGYGRDTHVGTYRVRASWKRC